MSNYVVAADAEKFLTALKDESVDLFLIDPPYYKIVRDLWDHKWESAEQYAEWLVGLLVLARKKIKPTGSLIMFQAIGKHGQHPLFDVLKGAEKNGWFFRNWITWKKSRSFGKDDNYLFARDEIIWFTASEKRGAFTFNPQWLDERNKRSTKNEFKKVSNVWSDIEQVFRPERSCRRPLPLLARLIKGHSNDGDLVVDFFAGFGTTGIVAHNLGRTFLGCEAIEQDALAADRRVTAAKENARSRMKAPTSGAHVVLGKSPTKTRVG
ncbi:MAG: site-specific DNA-methyltransferase [Labilithrix sp.]|nr:site-specific DNA-methyltransferase [Labilithrix sp.]MCW5811619.1 site-specific DNA-methyltransferase [Labilithrix sp.]